MSINYKQVDVLLEKIGRMLSKYDNMPEDEKIRHMISDKLKFDCDMSSQIKSGYNSLIELVQEWERLKSLKGENAYFGELSIEAEAMINLYGMHCEENVKDFQRAKYNLKTNNTIFSILDYVLNNNVDHNLVFEQNLEILQLNCSQFIINYYFEKIRDELVFVMDQDIDKIDMEMTKLCNKYNNNPQILQLMYEVLLQNFSSIREDSFMPKSRAIGDFLRARGVSGDRNTIPNTSMFILLRNCASHGEFYPDLDNYMVEAINTKRNRKVIRNLSFDEIISFTRNVSSLFNDEKIDIYNKLLFTTDITKTMEEIKKSYSTEELLKDFGILLIFNLIQYNNQHHFSKLDNDDTREYLDAINIKDYFSASFDKDSKSTYKFMDVIKNAIGHMNIEINGSSISFNNKLMNEIVSTDIVRMYDFIITSSISDLAMSTSFYVRLRAEIARIQTVLYSNKKIIDENENIYEIDNHKINDYYINNNKIRK